MNAISISAGSQRAVTGARTGPRDLTRKGWARLRALRLVSGGRNLLCGLLVLAAAAGIGHGVLWLVDLVQNCALFAAGVGRLI